jgi:hypothetical protein
LEACPSRVFHLSSSKALGCDLLAIHEVTPDRTKPRDVTVGVDLPFFGDQVGPCAILLGGSEQECMPVLETTAAKIEAMNHRTYQVPGCWAPRVSCFAAYCRSNRTALRRHGAVDQKANTKAQLKPCLKMVRSRIAKNPNSQAWVTLDRRWVALVDYAKGVVTYFESGTAGNRYELVAAREVVKLSGEVEPRQVAEVVAAMVIMEIMDPRWFKTDQAFWIQLGRRVRSLTDLHVGEDWDHKRQRKRLRYREFSPKAAIFLGHWLATALGAGGQGIAKVEQAERDRKARKAKERQELHAGLSKLV